MVLFGTVRANGAVLGPLIILAIGLYPVRFGFALGAYPWLGADALWLSFPVSCFVNMALAIAFYLHGGWRKAHDAAAQRRRMYRGGRGKHGADRAAQPTRLTLRHSRSLGRASARWRAMTRKALSPPSACAAAVRARGCAPCSPNTAFTPSDLIWPLFICEGQGCEEPIGALPGGQRWSVDRLADARAAGRRRRHSLHRPVPEHAGRTCAPTTAARRSIPTI